MTGSSLRSTAGAPAKRSRHHHHHHRFGLLGAAAADAGPLRARCFAERQASMTVAIARRVVTGDGEGWCCLGQAIEEADDRSGSRRLASFAERASGSSCAATCRRKAADPHSTLCKEFADSANILPSFKKAMSFQHLCSGGGRIPRRHLLCGPQRSPTAGFRMASPAIGCAGIANKGWRFGKGSSQARFFVPSRSTAPAVFNTTIGC